MATLRQARVGEMIRRDISEILLRELRDPRLAMVNVTSVEITRDFTIAQIFVSVLGTPAERSLAMRALRGASGFVRGRLGKMLELRSVPELKFSYDTGVDRGIKMFDVLKTEESALQGLQTEIQPGTYKEERVRGENIRAIRVDQVNFDEIMDTDGSEDQDDNSANADGTDLD